MVRPPGPWGIDLQPWQLAFLIAEIERRQHELGDGRKIGCCRRVGGDLEVAFAVIGREAETLQGRKALRRDELDALLALLGPVEAGCDLAQHAHVALDEQALQMHKGRPFGRPLRICA
jgi:hypothetical protein